MRSGGCTIQQALTTDAASVIKQALTLARRRGHAQVTPLHVANTMLSSSTGLFRTACLQSHSHPLQCKALELCFNVALNRLPASTSNPLLGGHTHQFPSISNALVAAFKRAQAHQRRGSIENLAVNVELEHLIISILDDPSVSRVMREAGFYSTQVKCNIEQAIFLETCSQGDTSSLTSKSSKETTSRTRVVEKVGNPSKESLDPITNEDVMSVIEHLVSNNRRNFVILGEYLSSVEGVVRGVMEEVEKGDVHETLRAVKFISVPVSSFGQLSKLELEQRMEELKGLIRSHSGKGLVLNLGDLKLVIEQTLNQAHLAKEGNSWSTVEQMILELGRFFSAHAEKSNGKLWLMGVATFHSYKKSKTKTVCGLHPFAIPAGILRLSLINESEQLRAQSTSSDAENASSNCFLLSGVEEKQLGYCHDPNFENEARSLQSSTSNGSNSATSNFPAWLPQYKNGKELGHNDHQECSSAKDICKKWNTISSSFYQQPDKILTFSSVSPSHSSISAFSYEQHHSTFNQTHHDHHSWIVSESFHMGNITPEDHSTQPFLSLSPHSTPNSTNSSDAIGMDHLHNFKELKSHNLKILCDALERKVAWQKHIIPDIATTILKCRSGIMRRKEKGIRTSITSEAKEDTWLFFQGFDVEAKKKIAKELARLVFGSHNNLVSIGLSNFSSTRADSTEDSRKKRTRNDQKSRYIDKFAEVVSSNPHRVFLVEDIEKADYCSLMGFKSAIERGRVASGNGEVGLGDAIIILSCESFSSSSRTCSPFSKLKRGGLRNDEEKQMGVPLIEEGSTSVSLDLNISIEEDGVEDTFIDDIDLLESVDRRVMFKIRDL